MSTLSMDLAILMPGLNGNYGRLETRYAGFSVELGRLGVSHYFAETHGSFKPESGGFEDVFDVHHQAVGELATASVVRDLTMSLKDEPVYREDTGLRLVHNPRINRLIADKSWLLSEAPGIHPFTRVVQADTIKDCLSEVPGDIVVVKPVTGQQSKGVKVLSKLEADRLELEAGNYLLQEWINTCGGIPSLGIEGVHNVRVLSIGSVARCGIARVRGTDPRMLANDVYGSYVDVADLPDTMYSIIDTVHGILQRQPGEGNNVIAIDIMRGVDGSGHQRDVLCEVNRRPMRVSEYDLNSGNLDDDAIRAFAAKWDSAEAAMLQRQLEVA